MPLQYDAFDQQIGRTNAILTEHETKHVKSRLHARMHQVHRIDSYLKNSKVDIPAVYDDRSSLVVQIDHYLVALAPFKRLPTELWQHIFLYVYSESDQAPPRATNPPQLLCRVCSSWRSIAVKMPELWNSLHFYSEKSYTPRQKLRAAQTFFSRAGCQPLSLTLSDTADTFPGVDFVQDLIVPFSRTFRSLHLVLRPPQIKALLSLPLGSLDAVEELFVVLHIGVAPVSILPAWKPHITVFGASSKLRRLRIQLTPFVVPQIFHLPWHRLETFRCDSSLQSEDCQELFLSCQALRKIHVRVFGIKYSTPPRVEMPLPNLTHLSVHLCDQESYDLFFLPLILPTLQSLMIYNYAGLPWSPRMYNGLVERSGCSVEELYLGTLDATAQDIVRVLERSPSLKTISLSHNTPINEELLRKIGQCEIGAYLQQLFIKGKRLLDPLLTMLEMRQEYFGLVLDTDGSWTSVSPLRFLETYAHPHDTFVHRIRIEHLRDIGVQVSLVQSEEGYFQL